MKLFDKMERKLQGLAIPHLMLYIIAANALVFLGSMADRSLLGRLVLVPERVLAGEVWRLLTFVMIPPSSSLLWILFALYFYYMIGTTLENQWGSYRFNLYYFTGMLGTIAGSMLSGVPVTGYYINLTLFFAFARLVPDMQLLLFLVLPVRIKYLAWFSWGILAFQFLAGGTSSKIAIAGALVNYLLFFGKDIVLRRKQEVRVRQRRQSYTREMPKEKGSFHRCEVCGRTEEDDPSLEFRFCSKCDGYHEYCSDHLFDHKHIQN
ncbi:hypothetical protein [Anaerotalea alkaliphila]|uniref:Rhomboid family intramembrane serine protease n=1 Tax=Anaerotalea alkaliphila TaxID=2662126 RepID=A0A7X5HUK9_9FIRM|nr:hypothetical protein [Anaerotalea alkaliphila]NDL66928.1 hypothetical protein [Anaerotalea alkaliphila]